MTMNAWQKHFLGKKHRNTIMGGSDDNKKSKGYSILNVKSVSPMRPRCFLKLVCCNELKLTLHIILTCSKYSKCFVTVGELDWA